MTTDKVGASGRAVAADAAEPVASALRASIPDAGDIVVIAHGQWGWNLHGERFKLAEVARVTPKKVFTVDRAFHRASHDKHLCTVVASREAGHRLIERLTSAKAELTDRVSKARINYQRTVEKLLASDTDGNPQGADAKQAAGESLTAGAEGIAQTPSGDNA